MSAISMPMETSTKGGRDTSAAIANVMPATRYAGDARDEH